MIKMTDSTFIVGLDVGGTKTEALVVDDDNRVLGRARQATNTSQPEGFLHSIAQTVHEALAQAGITPAQVRVIGVGVPGQVNNQTGVVQMAANLNIEAYPLAERLTAVFYTPTLIENDVRMAALGAYRFLQKKEQIEHMAYVSIGTGIAAGLILNGSLYRGANGMAGEIGHALIEPEGELCNCGQRGCLETIVSGPAIARQADKLMKRGDGRGPLTAKDVYAAAQSGDPEASKIVQRVSIFLGRAIQWLIMSYDVDKVVFGGGVASAGAAFLDPILDALSQLQAQSNLAKAMLGAEKLMLLPPDYNAGAWGAVYLAQKGDWQRKR